MKDALPTFDRRALASHLAYWPRTFALIWSAAPMWTVVWAVLLVVQGVLPVATVYVTKLLVDELAVAVGSSSPAEGFARTAVLLAITGGLMLLGEVFQTVLEWIRTAKSERVQDYIKDLVHHQSAHVDMAFFESPEFHDSLDRARTEAVSRPVSLLDSLGSAVQNGITLAAMAVVLVPYGVWLPVALLASTIPAFYVVLRSDRTYHRWWERATKLRRKTQYYDVMLTHADAAAEVRLFGLDSGFRAAYQGIRGGLRDERARLLRSQSLSRLGAASVGLVVTAGALAWMLWRAVHGAATLGDLALFYQAFSRGQALMRTMLGSVGQIYANTLFLGNLFTFLDLQPKIVGPANPAKVPNPVETGIAFENVTFRYPGTDRPALESFDVFVPAGKVVAIVGPNGAGKSTLVKLLCRFYDPDSGRITVDGVDVREFDVEELRRAITVLFQLPLNYHATARECIALGEPDSRSSHEAVEAAARAAGAHEFLSELPAGYDTPLGKWFADGSELSGGQWQRIAMARAYLKRSPIILLDEPTSFMDSWAEADWFERFRGLSEGRTALLITHRLSIAMRADLIMVLDDGAVVETGTHAELVDRGGLYAQSWTTQVWAADAAAQAEYGRTNGPVS